MPAKEKKFRDLISENQERIRRICRYYSREPEDQKDIYQEVLINIWKSLDTFRGEASIKTWIYRIAVNTALSYARKEIRRLNLYSGFDPEKLLNLVPDEDKATSVSMEAQVSLLEGILNQLSVIDRLLISLSLESLSTREIADIVGITEPNVRVKIHRIKEVLKSKLKGDGHEF